MYDDDEICEVVDCELYKSVQLVARPTAISDNYDFYSEKYRTYMFEYLYGNNTIENVLNEIEDITKIYNVSLNTKDNSVGLLYFILLVTLFAIIILSSVFLFIPNFKPYFEFIPTDFWIISNIGLLVMVSIAFTEYGDITNFKCQLRLIMLSLGISLNLIPILYRLVINFPEENKISEWVKENRYIFLFVFILIDIINLSIISIHPYESISNIYEDEEVKNFKICVLTSKFSLSMKYLFLLFKFLIFLVFLLLAFLEWNIKKFFYDIKFITTVIYINILSLLLLLLINVIDIYNYIFHFVIRVTVYLFFSLSNFVFLYLYRIVFFYIKKNTEDDDFDEKTVRPVNLKTGTSNGINVETITTDGKSSISGLYKKMLDYHNRTTISASTNVLNISEPQLGFTNSVSQMSQITNISHVTDNGIRRSNVSEHELDENE